MAQTMKIRKGDLVQVLTGKDRGKQGRVIEARPSERRGDRREPQHRQAAHASRAPMRNSSRMGGPQIEPGGVSRRRRRCPVSNVMVVCPTCNRATRVGYEFREIEGRAREGARLQARRLRPGDRPMMAAKPRRDDYAPRLKERYDEELRAAPQGGARAELDHAGAAHREDHAQHGRRRGEDQREGARRARSRS